MAIWKKQNKEEPACSSEKEKVFLSDDAMEMVSGGQEDWFLNFMPNDDVDNNNDGWDVYSEKIRGGK